MSEKILQPQLKIIWGGVISTQQSLYGKAPLKQIFFRTLRVIWNPVDIKLSWWTSLDLLLLVLLNKR